MTQEERNNLADYLIALADDRMILGERSAEWVGAAPMLEEEVSAGNLALDHIGQAQLLYEAAVALRPSDKSADSLVYERESHLFRPLLIVQQPSGDWAFTIARRYFYDLFDHLHLQKLTKVGYQPLADIAAKALVENRYHVRYSTLWMRRLGDGTDESKRRLSDALEELSLYVDEMFQLPEGFAPLVSAGHIANPADLKSDWEAEVGKLLSSFGMSFPKSDYKLSGGRSGRHSEHLYPLIAELQSVSRAHPGAEW